MLRTEAVAGQFYPAQADSLNAVLDTYFDPALPQGAALGLIVPHAGYVYSGHIAACAYAATEIPAQVVLLGPNHRGVGAAAAVYPDGAWRTPLGQVPVAAALATHLIDHCTLLEADRLAHQYEHSLEVQLPFLQHQRQDVQIAPISLGRGNLNDWLQLGRQLGLALQNWPGETLLIASTDMNHFKSAAQTLRLDRLAIDHLEALDPAGLYAVVHQQHISMCGVIPAVVLLEATNILGASSCRLLRYDHSGSVNGDSDSVVGYAALQVV